MDCALRSRDLFQQPDFVREAREVVRLEAVVFALHIQLSAVLLFTVTLVGFSSAHGSGSALTLCSAVFVSRHHHAIVILAENHALCHGVERVLQHDSDQGPDPATESVLQFPEFSVFRLVIAKVLK